MNAKLLELAERCEKAHGTDLRLDAEIEVAVQQANGVADAKVFMLGSLPAAGKGKGRKWSMLFQHFRYTASVDAALRLVPKGAYWSADSRCYAIVGDGPCRENNGFSPNFIDTDIAASPALALCAAALRARVCDSGSDAKHEDPRSGAEPAGAQSGGSEASASPETQSIHHPENRYD